MSRVNPTQTLVIERLLRRLNGSGSNFNVLGRDYVVLGGRRVWEAGLPISVAIVSGAVTFS